jgi:PPM family protein phosphatase
LTGEVSDALIAAVLLTNTDPQTAAQQLISAVLAGPGRDNVTAIVVDALKVSSGSEPAVGSSGDAVDHPDTLEVPDDPLRARGDTQPHPVPDPPQMELP